MKEVVPFWRWVFKASNMPASITHVTQEHDIIVLIPVWLATFDTDLRVLIRILCLLSATSTVTCHASKGLVRGVRKNIVAAMATVKYD